MKNSIIALIISSCFSLSTVAQEIADTVYREDQMIVLLENIQNDPILQAEWLTSIHFHKLLNDYRKEKGAKSIYWDHKLWMSARNQNIYLLRSLSSLNHWQSHEKRFFTGVQPENRVDFVTFESGQFQAAGFENCYFYGKDVVKDRMDFNKFQDLTFEQINTKADKTAQRAFQWWKKSSGHNKNMLNSDHLAHGTSFVFGRKGMYATSVFASKQRFYQPDSVFLSFFSDKLDWKNYSIAQNYQVFTPYPNWNDLVKQKYTNAIRLFFDKYGASRSEKLKTLLNTMSHTASQQQAKQLYKEQNGLAAYFELLTNELKLHQYEFELTQATYEELTGMKLIQHTLANLIKNNPTNIEAWEANIYAEHTEQKVRLKVDLLLFYKK